MAVPKILYLSGRKSTARAMATEKGKNNIHQQYLVYRWKVSEKRQKGNNVALPLIILGRKRNAFPISHFLLLPAFWHAWSSCLYTGIVIVCRIPSCCLLVKTKVQRRRKKNIASSKKKELPRRAGRRVKAPLISRQGIKQEV
jgi:hypothetical protein